MSKHNLQNNNLIISVKKLKPHAITHLTKEKLILNDIIDYKKLFELFYIKKFSFMINHRYITTTIYL